MGMWKNPNMGTALTAGANTITALGSNFAPPVYDPRIGMAKPNPLGTMTNFQLAGTGAAFGPVGMAIGGGLDVLKNLYSLQQQNKAYNEATNKADFYDNQSTRLGMMQPDFTQMMKKGGMAQYNAGGMVPAQMESNEIVLIPQPDGSYTEYMQTGTNAPTHEQGGVNTQLPPGAIVFPAQYVQQVKSALAQGDFASISQMAQQMLQEGEQAKQQGQPYTSGAGGELPPAQQQQVQQMPQQQGAGDMMSGMIPPSMRCGGMMKMYGGGGMIEPSKDRAYYEKAMMEDSYSQKKNLVDESGIAVKAGNPILPKLNPLTKDGKYLEASDWWTSDGGVMAGVDYSIHKDRSPEEIRDVNTWPKNLQEDKFKIDRRHAANEKERADKRRLESSKPFVTYPTEKKTLLPKINPLTGKEFGNGGIVPDMMQSDDYAIIKARQEEEERMRRMQPTKTEQPQQVMENQPTVETKPKELTIDEIRTADKSEGLATGRRSNDLEMKSGDYYGSGFSEQRNKAYKAQEKTNPDPLENPNSQNVPAVNISINTGGKNEVATTGRQDRNTSRHQAMKTGVYANSRWDEKTGQRMVNINGKEEVFDQNKDYSKVANLSNETPKTQGKVKLLSAKTADKKAYKDRAYYEKQMAKDTKRQEKVNKDAGNYPFSDGTYHLPSNNLYGTLWRGAEDSYDLKDFYNEDGIRTELGKRLDVSVKVKAGDPIEIKGTITEKEQAKNNFVSGLSKLGDKELKNRLDRVSSVADAVSTSLIKNETFGILDEYYRNVMGVTGQIQDITTAKKVATAYAKDLGSAAKSRFDIPEVKNLRPAIINGVDTRTGTTSVNPPGKLNAEKKSEPIKNTKSESATVKKLLPAKAKIDKSRNIFLDMKMPGDYKGHFDKGHYTKYGELTEKGKSYNEAQEKKTMGKTIPDLTDWVIVKRNPNNNLARRVLDNADRAKRDLAFAKEYYGK